jgi:hypothetical protein
MDKFLSILCGAIVTLGLPFLTFKLIMLGEELELWRLGDRGLSTSGTIAFLTFLTVLATCFLYSCYCTGKTLRNK